MIVQLKNHSRKQIVRALAKKAKVWLFTDARDPNVSDVYIAETEIALRAALVQLHAKALIERHDSRAWPSEWKLEPLIELTDSFREPR